MRLRMYFFLPRSQKLVLVSLACALRTFCIETVKPADLWARSIKSAHLQILASAYKRIRISTFE